MRDVLDRKRMPQHAVAHAAPGRVAHLAVLQMKPRVGEAIEIAGVVVMQMGDDDVPDAVGRDAKVRQRIDRIERQLAGTRLRLFGIEAGIDQDVAAAARGSARRNNRGPAPWSRADRGSGNSYGGCAATSSHSAARRFRRHFPSVSLFFSWMLRFGRCRHQAIVIRKGQTRAANGNGMTGRQIYVRGITLCAVTREDGHSSP